MKLFMLTYLLLFVWAGYIFAQTESVTDAVQNKVLAQHSVDLDRNARAIEDLRAKIYELSDSLSQLKAIGTFLGLLQGAQIVVTVKLKKAA